MYIQSAEERDDKIILWQTPASNNGTDGGGILNSCAYTSKVICNQISKRHPPSH